MSVVKINYTAEQMILFISIKPVRDFEDLASRLNSTDQELQMRKALAWNQTQSSKIVSKKIAARRMRRAGLRVSLYFLHPSERLLPASAADYFINSSFLLLTF